MRIAATSGDLLRDRPGLAWVALWSLCAICALPVCRADEVKQSTASVSDLWNLAESQLSRGAINDAERTLRSAAAASTTDAARAGSARRLAAALVRGGRTTEAASQLNLVSSLRPSLSNADRAKFPLVQGLLAARQGDLASAERYFEEAATVSKSEGGLNAEVQARINSLRARIERKELAELEPRLHLLIELAGRMPESDESSRLLVAVAELHRTAVNDLLASVTLRQDAYNALQRARQYARSDASRASAVGYIGALYEDEGRWEEAQALTSQAIFLAQAAEAPDQVFRWEWQRARLQRQLGNLGEAQRSLNLAVDGLSELRADVLQDSRKAYVETVEPLYLDFADVNLRRAAQLVPGSDDEQRLLRQVRDELESLKQAEVQDYFESACAVESRSSSGAGFSVPGVAVVYPILLKDRIEVLVEADGVLSRFSAQVPGGQVTATVRQLRLGLERAGATDTYLTPAKSLYRWLIADADTWLASRKIDTLIIVPSGALRTIPFSVLNDGQRFLVEKYAVSTTPAVTLLDSLTQAQIEQLLVAGLSQGVQGFSQLPGVEQEVSMVVSLFPSQSLRNEAFQLSAVESQLANTSFSAAHLATHGEFNADHRKSFILTYDNRLTMEGLKDVLSRRDAPLDLLVLSACKTAAGDDRAALGLAGVAVQAGARSALASLWYISDQATTDLMTEFYKNMKSGSATKAQSLRSAQLALLKSEQYRHPTYWAPYLLIGSWL